MGLTLGFDLEGNPVHCRVMRGDRGKETIRSYSPLSSKLKPWFSATIPVRGKLLPGTYNKRSSSRKFSE